MLLVFIAISSESIFKSNSRNGSILSWPDLRRLQNSCLAFMSSVLNCVSAFTNFAFRSFVKCSLSIYMHTLWQALKVWWACVHMLVSTPAQCLKRLSDLVNLIVECYSWGTVSIRSVYNAANPFVTKTCRKHRNESIHRSKIDTWNKRILHNSWKYNCNF